MTSNFNRLRELFEQCVDLGEGERLLWLEQHVPDTGQRIELELMLAADSHEGGFIQRDVVSHIGHFGEAVTTVLEPEADAGHLIGRRFGAFELQRLLGRGGQGAVYLAQRVGDDFQQTVAVKLLRRGLHDPAEHRRFRREREILARFEHPGVARLIDGGVSAEGVPYLAMEYVDGVSIDRWCGERGLEQRARLRLFSQLCGVVAAAHRALIVHRDLKPSNVLVTADGAIKVLDFGIARLLDEDDGDGNTHSPLLTPGYGAPEQASGGVITLATDVYALGVLLRVLLTGQLPATAPGQVAAALPADLAPELRWILGKASAADTELRYRDAAELDEDVRRYLEARPVRAHPPSRSYRARKFVQRHRGSLLVTAAVVLGILASLGVALWQAQVAREQARRAEAVRDFLLGVFEAAQEDLPKDARPTPDVLARAAAKRVQADTRLAATTRADFLSTLGEISKLANDYAQAVDFQEQALQALGPDVGTPTRQRLDIEIARAWGLLGLGRAQEVEQSLGPRLSALRAVADHTAVDGLWAYSQARQETGHLDEALALTQELVALAEQAYEPDSVHALRVRLVYSRIVTEKGDIAQAAQLLESALTDWRALAIPEQQDYATALANLASLKRRLGDSDGAERLLREGLALSERIHPGVHEDTALQQQFLARLLGERGQGDEAVPLMQASAAALNSLFDENHPLVIGTLANQAALALESQRYAEAADLAGRATVRCQQASLANEQRCMTAWLRLGFARLQLQRLDEADAAVERSLALNQQLFAGQHPDYGPALRAQAELQLARGEATVALDRVDRALAFHVAKRADQTLDAASAQGVRARALLALARPAEALAALEQAEAINVRLAPAHHGRRLLLLAQRAEVLAALNRATEARAAAQAALALAAAQAVLAPGQWQRLQALALP